MIYYGPIRGGPLGDAWTAVSANGVLALNFKISQEEMAKELERATKQQPTFDIDAVGDVALQLDRFFRGERLEFEISIDWTWMRDFQRDVLQRVMKIPAGQVKTYGQIARELGRTDFSARAVGRANATNPIPVIIPCHRVVGVNGDLTGYGGPGGIKTKAWLLSLEGYEHGQQLELPL